MAFSKPLAALLLAVALAATAMSAAGQDPQNCKPSRNVTVQNLCGKDLSLGIEPLANSKLLYSPGHLLRQGTHVSFTVCSWTGRVKVQDAVVTEFHLGYDGGAWYQVSTDQSRMPIRVSITPHGHPLKDHCPTAGCTSGGKCFEHSVPGGKCHGVDEIKIVFYKP
ncbi:hypothetical protein D1007_46622 [Hordeum vulgare]|uniref:Predicted protein n=1 Tax=Hordeum vulgare subsp. vulgare TaxID=112509 RepID=F2CPQ3_HORVV|nr:uncharacterized protein LOC123395507 [Hordeum vulgare subsp. vulgare]KAE8780230.1 hypothetical protein D1007_46622 [Hordeum vulgare]KAI4987367.1 hypothetical protein ZWY2020_020167 [Hordeum vulgare]BAJ84824.1 predicted protein [Hordeum vulgare subsp. vulgare]